MKPLKRPSTTTFTPSSAATGRTATSFSKRRYSKKERYAIPYNDEEVYLYWANRDQYYAKTGEYFTDYSYKLEFRQPTLPCPMRQGQNSALSIEFQAVLAAETRPF